MNAGAPRRRDADVKIWYNLLLGTAAQTSYSGAFMR